jgi:hypothetical protein
MKTSTIAHKYPTFRDDKFKSCKKWLDGKRIDDNAEGLWRVHDKLYDLTDFIAKHPGGADWLEVTKGIDITEQFETHHIRDVAEKLLPKFYVRDAELPRNYKITFDKDDFYLTLKRRVASKLETLDSVAVLYSIFYCDLMFGLTVWLSILSAYKNDFKIAMLAGAALCLLALIAHNFIHQKNNWRMYLTNFSMLTFREQRSENKLKIN